jgi:hypothetical protein
VYSRTSNSHKFVFLHSYQKPFITDIATYLHLADTLVVLDASGSLAYSGPSANWISSNDDIAKGQDEEVPEKPSNIFKPDGLDSDAKQADSRPRVENDIETVKRQKGDFGVWKYYGRSIGWLPILLTAICIAINVFGNNFQSEIQQHSVTVMG